MIFSFWLVRIGSIKIESAKRIRHVTHLLSWNCLMDRSLSNVKHTRKNVTVVALFQCSSSHVFILIFWQQAKFIFYIYFRCASNYSVKPFTAKRDQLVFGVACTIVSLPIIFSSISYAHPKPMSRVQVTKLGQKIWMFQPKMFLVNLTAFILATQQ